MLKHTVALALAALVSAACEVRTETAGRAEGAFERTLKVSRPASLEVTSRSGSIRVLGNAGGASEDIHIVRRIRAYDTVWWPDTYRAADRGKELEADPPIEQPGNSTRVGDLSDWWSQRGVAVSYEVTVPPDTRVTTSTRSGDQLIEVIRGSVDASSRSGALRLGDVRGSLTLSTRSGDIVVSGTPTADWQVRTRSGDVSLRVPPETGFDIEARTRSGIIVTNREGSGEFDRRSLQSRVRGGGALVSVTTRSGSIHLE